MMQNRKVVYTALTRGYDVLEQHQYVNPLYDYVCFSNDFGDADKVGIWNIRKIEYHTDDLQLLSRYPKLQPHEVLPEYDYSLYVDANVNICTPYLFRRIDELLSEDVLLAGVKHQFRDCIYEEGYVLILGGVEKNAKLVREQLGNYKLEGLPRHFGMYEANVIFRQHNRPLVMSQSNDWWRLRCQYSKRDQLGLSYTLWKHGLPWHYLLPENEWARNSKEVFCRTRPWKYPYLKQKTYNFYTKYIVPAWFGLTMSNFYRSL